MQVTGWQRPAPDLPIIGLLAPYSLEELSQALQGVDLEIQNHPAVDRTGRSLRVLAMTQDRILLTDALPQRCAGCSE